jgi:hypothetical protein
VNSRKSKSQLAFTALSILASIGFVVAFPLWEYQSRSVLKLSVATAQFFWFFGVLAAFRLGDRMVERLSIQHREYWLSLGSPAGIFWRPLGVPWWRQLGGVSTHHKITWRCMQPEVPDSQFFRLWRWLWLTNSMQMACGALVLIATIRML